MGKFILGIIFALLVIAIAAVGYTHLGFAPIAADTATGPLDRYLLGAARDPSVERHAPHVDNPVPITDDNLIQGMQVYLMNCTPCHGGLDKKPSAVGRAMYPRAPQFLARGRPIRDPEWFIYYVTQKGIRRTGMPSWEKILSADEIWKVTAFLSRTDKLPPAVKQRWAQAVPAEPPK